MHVMREKKRKNREFCKIDKFRVNLYHRHTHTGLQNWIKEKRIQRNKKTTKKS